MAGRGKAGKRFLAYRRRPALQSCQQLWRAGPQEYAASPAIARMFK